MEKTLHKLVHIICTITKKAIQGVLYTYTVLCDWLHYLFIESFNYHTHKGMCKNIGITPFTKKQYLKYRYKIQNSIDVDID